MAGLTTSLPIGRIVGSLYGTAMVCGLSYIVDNFDEVYHQIIQPGKTYHQTIQTEKNDSHDFTSNGTCPAYVRDPLMSTKVEDPATDFWYSNMQIPAPYIQFDNAPWRHAAPDTRKVGAQASPEAFQKMMDFALFGILVYACLLTTFRVLQFIFGGKTTTRTRTDARSGSGDLGNQNLNNFQMILSIINSNNTAQSQANGLISTNLEEILSRMSNLSNIEERIGRRIQESNSELQRSSGDLRTRLEGFKELYTTDQHENNAKSDKVQSKLKTLESKIQALIRNYEELNELVKADDTNSRILSMSAKVEHISKLVETNDIKDGIQAVDEKIEQLSNGKIEALEEKIEKVNNANDKIKTLNDKFEDLNKFVRANNSDRKIQAFGASIEKLSHQASKALTVDSPQFKALDNRVFEVLNEVSEAPMEFLGLQESTQRLTLKIEILEREIQKVSNTRGDFQTLEIKIGEMQKDILTLTARRNDVQSLNEPLKKMQEELQMIKDISRKLQEIQKNISALLDNGGDVQSMTEKLDKMTQKINNMLEKVQDSSQKTPNIQEEVQQKHASAVSRLEADLQDLEKRLTSQDTRVDVMNEAHQKKLNTHEESLNSLRIDLDKIETENKRSLEDLRREISEVESNTGAIDDRVQHIANATVQSHINAYRDEVKDQLHDELKQLDLPTWSSRLESLIDQVNGFKQAVEQFIKDNLTEQLGKFDIKECKCSDVNLAGNTGDLEDSIKESMAEKCTDCEKKFETRIETVENNLEFFEGARANNGERLEEIDERVKGIEHQVEKTKEIFIEKFSLLIKSSHGEDQQECRDQKLDKFANNFKEQGLGYGISVLLDRVEGIQKRLKTLHKSVHGKTDILTEWPIIDQILAIQEELKLVWYGMPINSADTELLNFEGTATDNQKTAPSQQSTTTANETVGQQAPAPILSNAPMVPQHSSVSQPIFRYQAIGDPDEIPPEMLAILAYGPPSGDTPVSQNYQSNQPIPFTQTVPVLQTATTTEQVNVDQQAPLQQPPDDSPPATSDEQPTASQARPSNISGRKIKVPMSRKKPYHKQQPQQQLQPPTTDDTLSPQQQQSQQQQQPLVMEDIIDMSQLADMTMTEPTSQFTTTQPPPLPEVCPEPQANLEAEAQGKAQELSNFHNNYDDLFEEFGEIPGLSEKLDEEERKIKEEKRRKEEETRIEEEKRRDEEKILQRNVPLSLPGNVPAVDVPQNTQTETNQGASNIQGEPPTQERRTIPEVQRNVASPVETSMSVKTSEEQKKADETAGKKSASFSSSQQLSLSQSRWADIPNDSVPQGESSGSVKDSEQKQADETVKERPPPSKNSPSNGSQSAPKHADKAPQSKTTRNPAKASEDSRKAPGAVRITKLPGPTRPLPLPFTGQSMSWSALVDKQKGQAPQTQIATSPRKTSGEQKGAGQTAKKSLQSQGPSLGDNRQAQSKDNAASKSEATSDPVEESSNREVRHQAVIEGFSKYKGTPLSESRWADPPDGEKSSKKEETPEAVKKGSSTTTKEKTLNEESLVTPEKQKAPRDGTASNPAKGSDDREVRHQAVPEGVSKYRGTPLSESRWAVKSEEQEESTKTPTRDARSSPSGTAVKALEKAYSNAKGKGKSVDANILATPAKQKEVALKAEARSNPAEEPSNEEERFEAVKGAWETIKGKSLSESRWADKIDEKENTTSTPKNDAESSPSGGSKGSEGRYKVRNVDLKKSFSTPGKMTK
ncbi:conserved hypothetical protein [Talaromyces marneffei ATCC 18224]|uniref:Uncharacterized protein n=1 Tax=Talaromyces marneffei (strain ATCC 18224 / CBS 334.59 / QM 7333) TaxID=441960 RepID=B6QPE5_TALMQ|nr:conserved hypothetical protein [Talaromyces marneffei ATCC 18224]